MKSITSLQNSLCSICVNIFTDILLGDMNFEDASCHDNWPVCFLAALESKKQ